ncbi:MAG: DUF1697 domain-containing protein [Gemmataceae bacterium]
MALVVLLRGVNVGGHKSFSPKALAGELADFDAVNVGAAGTFVIRKSVSAAALRGELVRRLPVQAEFMMCRAREILELMDREPFRDHPTGPEMTRYVSMLADRPRTLPPLPLSQPAGEDWQVRVIEVSGRFALSLHRRQGRTLVYPNEVVEKKFGVSATTRNWNTITAICEILNGN